MHQIMFNLTYIETKLLHMYLCKLHFQEYTSGEHNYHRVTNTALRLLISSPHPKLYPRIYSTTLNLSQSFHQVENFQGDPSLLLL